MKHTVQHILFFLFLVALFIPCGNSQHTHIEDNAEALRLDGTAPYQTFYNGSRYNAYIQANNANLWMYNRNAGSIFLGTSNTARATINASGNLGIGTTTPAQKLDVIGTARSSGGVPEFQLYDNASGENRIEGRFRESGDDIFLESLIGDLRLNSNNEIRLTVSKPDNHVIFLENSNTSTGADLLALKVGRTSNPTGSNNYITFFRGDDSTNGRIEGNGSGGVLYGTTGADFAESLPVSSKEIKIEKGDVVGVYEGKISHNTNQATDVMVITDRPAVLGNQQSENTEGYENVSFIGQVPVKVIGRVDIGDWIVASGQNDGIAKAIKTQLLGLDHKIIGKAWEANSNDSLKKVNVAVGLDNSDSLKSTIYQLINQIKKLEDKVARIENNSADSENSEE